jgi:serine/arginine repetitive matrix protein 2
MLRVGVVESILTPVTVSPQNRPHSYSGETSSATNHNEHRQQDQPSSSRATGVVSGDVARARTFSGLNPLVSEATRISYMTTSTVSRMSDLSDFPVPPKDHRVSLGTYFNEPLPPAPPLTEEQQHLFFGRNQDAGDLAKTLSSN